MHPQEISEQSSLKLRKCLIKKGHFCLQFILFPEYLMFYLVVYHHQFYITKPENAKSITKEKHFFFLLFILFYILFLFYPVYNHQC